MLALGQGGEVSHANPTGVMLHVYIFALALAAGVAFGAAAAFVPLLLGFAALIVSEVV